MPDWLTRREVRTQPEPQSPLEALLAKVDARVDRLTDRYFRAMGEHIKDLGKLPPSDVHRLEQLRRMNRSLSSILRGIAAASKLDEAEILKAFRETAEEDARMAASVLNVSPERAREIPRLERIVRAQARETAGAMKNLSNTTVASEGYRKLVDSAVTAVQSGVEDYGSAIRHAIREAGGSGLRVKYESGQTRRLDTAIRMNILDGVRHLTQQVLIEVGREFGADGVEIDAHMLCAEDHLPYQGRQFSNEEFEEIQSSLARPFGEWNCRHVWHPILLGVSAPAYTEAEREEMRRYSTEEVEIDGRTKTRYEWSQEMRRCETAVRAAKDTANLAREAGDDELRRQCQRRINALNDHYTHLASAAGLKPEYTRTYVGGFVDAAERAAMARGYAIGPWPAAGVTITSDTHRELKAFAKENGVVLHGFERFNGDVGLIRDFIEDMRSVVTSMKAESLFERKRLHLMTDYTMAPDDYAITHRTTITINPAAFRDRDILARDYAKKAREQWFVPGTDYRSIAKHEMGHAIIHALGLSPNQIHEIVQGIGARSISKYAAMTDGETIAESFSAYFSGIHSNEALTVIQRCATIIDRRR